MRGSSVTSESCVAQIERSGVDHQALQVSTSNDTMHISGTHVVGNGVVKPEATKLHTIKQFPLPTMNKQVRFFLGLTGYYRRFIPNYATIATPLTKLIRKDQPETVSWSERM